jgi:hypothetical protein
VRNAHDLGRDEDVLRRLHEVAFRIAQEAEAFARNLDHAFAELELAHLIAVRRSALHAVATAVAAIFDAVAIPSAISIATSVTITVPVPISTMTATAIAITLAKFPLRLRRCRYCFGSFGRRKRRRCFIAAELHLLGRSRRDDLRRFRSSRIVAGVFAVARLRFVLL